MLQKIRLASTIQINIYAQKLHESVTIAQQVDKVNLVKRSIATHPNHDQKRTVLLTDVHPNGIKSKHFSRLFVVFKDRYKIVLKIPKIP
jgi:hypothetical protein